MTAITPAATHSSIAAACTRPPAECGSFSASSSFCPAFPDEEALDAYLSSIAPPRELICPITQELLRDPVVAEDGHTYERGSLVTWFGMGRSRSPVTNSLLENTSAEGLVTNLAVASMAVAHRERLGRELIGICQGIKERGGRCDLDGASARVEGLLDAGADPNGRSEGNNTPLHLLIQSGSIHLATHLLNHDASVMLVNDAGLDCIAAAKQAFAKQRPKLSRDEPGGNRAATVSEWDDFVQELKRRETSERARAEARDRARSRANEDHRERQRALAANALSNPSGDHTNEHGLGRLEDGVGYFPSLATLQFQSSIPGPSPSVAEYENWEKERLNGILRGICCIIVIYFLLS